MVWVRAHEGNTARLKRAQIPSPHFPPMARETYANSMRHFDGREQTQRHQRDRAHKYQCHHTRKLIFFQSIFFSSSQWMRPEITGDLSHIKVRFQSAWAMAMPKKRIQSICAPIRTAHMWACSNDRGTCARAHGLLFVSAILFNKTQSDMTLKIIMQTAKRRPRRRRRKKKKISKIAHAFF